MYRLQLIGHSKIAGRVGLSQTALTRCIAVPCSCLLLPPLIMAGLKRSALIQKSPRLRLGIELAVIYLSLQAALPAALAVFPQVSSLPSLLYSLTSYYLSPCLLLLFSLFSPFSPSPLPAVQHPCGKARTAVPASHLGRRLPRHCALRKQGPIMACR